MGIKYDFSGWATRNDLKCSDGRTIRKDAFKDCDGMTVPLVWNHQHGNSSNVLGHALLENRDEGVYTYGCFNDTEEGIRAKKQVEHGDITALSIYANQLKQRGGDVLHGAIREVSLVLAGANPGAFIDDVVMSHSDDADGEAIIYTGEPVELMHAEQETAEKKETEKVADENKKAAEGGDKTVGEIFNTLNEEQKKVVYYLIGQAVEDAKGGSGDEKNEEDEEVKHNAFENNDEYTGSDDTLYISHADQETILANAKKGGTFRGAVEEFFGDTLQHGIDDIETLFPDPTDVYKGEPETFKRDLSWVGSVMNGVHKAPYARVRTRFADARAKELRAKGYIKGDRKTLSGNIKLLQRTTDPQTIYRKDAIERDDILDITDFDVVNYQYGIMRENLEEDIALAIMIGDDRDDTDREQIKPEHVRPIWLDDEMYTLHYDVDIDGMKTTLNGSETGQHFGDNYIYAEAIIQQLLYAREKYKGSGSLAMYCTPHLVNVMLLARDLNGRRIYNNLEDLKAALNVSAIHTVEQFEGKIRTTSDNHRKQLLGLFVNLKDYQVGSVRGGQITKFQQFDIDFNQEKMLLETRISGAMIKPWAAIALELDVTE